eukprot:971100-Rhodomonas_salina.1
MGDTRIRSRVSHVTRELFDAWGVTWGHTRAATRDNTCAGRHEGCHGGCHEGCHEGWHVTGSWVARAQDGSADSGSGGVAGCRRLCRYHSLASCCAMRGTEVAASTCACTSGVTCGGCGAGYPVLSCAGIAYQLRKGLVPAGSRAADVAA